jgi:S-adenosylmethionine hydrolase
MNRALVFLDMKQFAATTFILFHLYGFGQNKMIVFQSDFGLKDGAVSAMKGIAMTVSADLRLYDITHEIPAFNTWEAAYRLEQAIAYWPAGTVFVSVVDPGVGTARKSVVVKTRSGHFIVTPDNGTLTLVAESQGIEEVREIDEGKNRRKNSEASYTFHGRDVYAYTAARLASRAITFEEVGTVLTRDVVKLSHKKAYVDGSTIRGTIPVLDVQYGNVWTNIADTLLKRLKIKSGDVLKVSIYRNGRQVYSGVMPFHETFGKVAPGKPLAYLNSLMQLSFAINQGSFAKKYGIGSGNEWSVRVSGEQAQFFK